MSDANYRIRYKKGNFEIEVQGDKAWVEGKFKELKKEIILKEQLPNPNSPSSTPPMSDVLQGSIVEFIKAKGNPRKHMDRVILFAYWLFKKENMSSFNSIDISNCYDESRIPKPANPSDIINKIQAQGFVTIVKEDKDGRKAWVITSTGETYVDQMNA